MNMNKVVIGLALGGVLGIFDGLTAWFTPEARAGLAGIVVGSCFKGILTGLAAGFFARKIHNIPLGILIGLAVGMALSYSVAAMQGKYYFEIILPGSILGIIVGFATQKLPRPA
jgi:hypothetical protein